ncbi:hypothetical protein [Endozoicomonas sp. SESOKO1]|uniref:hypothetical protein n=1 Tax=Endozoicomonas sp. SESOKO1 TaxID=2828742 RepID=UPI0021486E60|nr:hypothetical protein [Endozoicomonas sp. SESOKO1]
MIDAIKPHVFTIVIALFAAFGSYQVNAYRLDQVEIELANRDSNIVIQAKHSTEIELLKVNLKYMREALDRIDKRQQAWEGRLELIIDTAK